MNKQSVVTLNNGVKMPIIGYGTYKSTDYEQLRVGIRDSIAAGYRHIDTASFYGNEKAIGDAIAESILPREDLFITSKVWNTEQGYDEALKAFNRSINKLGTDYLDLYLIHWPQLLNKETWKALEKLNREGYVKAIGVSNFTVKYLKDLMESANIMPTVNQIEFHPMLVDHELMDFCRDNNIQVEAWSPLMRGVVFEIPLLQDIANKYSKSVSQIVLRWNLQMGVTTIPKSVTKSRIYENINIFDFEISKEDMCKISSLNTGKRVGSHPDQIYAKASIIKG